MKDLHELKEMLCKELEQYGRKGELNAGSLDVVDKLAHAIKNIDKIIDRDGEEYSGRYVYDDGSYARRRDARGRYTSMDGYSRHEDMLGELRYLMHNAPDERTKMEFQKFITKMEQSM